jgi:signal transduction histidine kinase
VWIYAPGANAFRWANRAGLAFWGADDLAALRARDLSDIRAATRQRLEGLLTWLAGVPSITETWTVYPQGSPRTVACTHWRVEMAGEPCLAIMALPSAESVTQDDLRLRDRVLEAVAHSAERLLNGRDRLRERERLLAELGEATGVDRAYVFDFHPPAKGDSDGDGEAAASPWIASQTFEWCAPDVAPQIDNPELQNIDMAAHFPRWVARFRDGKPVVAAGPEQFPPAEREVLGPQGITAICVHPVLVDGWPAGFIGFDIVDRADRPAFPGWTQNLVDALATAAHLMAGATRMAAAQNRLRQAILDARQASQAKSDFLANMSHELRTPLNAIIGFSDVLRQELLGPMGAPRYRAYADDIHAAGTHLLGLIGDVLDHAKAESGTATLYEERCALVADILQPSVRLVAARAAKDDVAVQIAPEVTDVTLDADARKLVQVLTNLLSNAVKFSPAGTQVTLGTRLLADGRLAIEVSDQGCGMSESDLRLALEPFAQVGGTNRRHHEGTGLGLSLARQLSELHGGELVLESALDAGTTVRVLLPAERIDPCARAPEARTAGQPALAAGSAGRRG